MLKTVEKLLNARRVIDEHLRQIQADCDHLGAQKIARGNTGNYDPSADSYWWECLCPRCGRHWTTPQ
jgi:hypothetical protein